MPEIKSRSTIEMTVTMTLTEAEARAIEAMTKYGADAFLKGYYKYLGKSYMQPHEKGLKMFFRNIMSNLPQHIKRVDEARKTFTNEH